MDDFEWRVTFSYGDGLIPGPIFGSRERAESFLLAQGYTEKIEDHGASFKAQRAREFMTACGPASTSYTEKELDVVAICERIQRPKMAWPMPDFCASRELGDGSDLGQTYAGFQSDLEDYYERENIDPKGGF